MATSENSRSKLGSKREVAPGKWVIRVQAGFRADDGFNGTSLDAETL